MQGKLFSYNFDVMNAKGKDDDVKANLVLDVHSDGQTRFPDRFIVLCHNFGCAFAVPCR